MYLCLGRGGKNWIFPDPSSGRRAGKLEAKGAGSRGRAPRGPAGGRARPGGPRSRSQAVANTRSCLRSRVPAGQPPGPRRAEPSSWALAWLGLEPAPGAAPGAALLNRPLREPPPTARVRPPACAARPVFSLASVSRDILGPPIKSKEHCAGAGRGGARLRLRGGAGCAPRRARR